VLELLAVAGGPLTVKTLEKAAAIGSVDGAIGHLERDQLLRRYGPGSVDLWPNPLRPIIANGLTNDARRALHQLLADALGALDAAPDLRATHLLAAGQRPEAAAQFVRAAHDASAKLAFDRAADLYQQALDAGARVRVHHAEALARAGRNIDAGEAFLMAVEDAPAESERLRRRAADQFLRGGHLKRGLAIWRTVLAPLGIGLPRATPDTLLGVAWRLLRIALRGNRFRPRDEADVPPQLLRRVDLTWELAQGLGIIDPLRGIHIQASSLLLALRAGHAPRVARALTLDSVRFAVVSRRGQAKAHALLDRARGLIDRDPDPYAEGLILLASSILATHEGRWQQARRLGTEAAQSFRSLDATRRWEVEMSTYFRIAGAWWLGDVPTCLEELPLLISDARARGDRLSVAHFVLGPSYSPHLFRGAPELADDEIEEAHAQWRGLSRALPYVYAFRSRLGVAAYTGDTTRLRQVIDEMWPAMRRHPALRRVAYMRAATGDALCRTGLLLIPSEGAKGRRLFERGLRLMRRTDLAWSQALARLHTAQMRRAEGERGAARDAFRQAADDLRREEMGLFERIARVRHAELAGDGERRAQALHWIAAHGASDPEAIVRWLSP
ncbi:MAG: hypothetical protein KC620_23625, partial [Myxococcales bacterium]|nr:hypothetical protein [Myxococcales bacterium]